MNMRRRVIMIAAATLGAASPASAQFGAVEALLSNVTDVSFYAGSGVLFPKPDLLKEAEHGLASYGVELLFEIGAVRRRSAVQPPPPSDSVELEWTAMEVRRAYGRADTVYTYEPRPVSYSPAYDTVWTFELGVGYGQTMGFEAADPSLELRGSVRDLPAVTVYATYEPSGTYFGMRTGFMKTQALQVATAEESFSASAEAFLLGAVVGQSFDVSMLTMFLEVGYMVRHFPSVEWSDGGPLPPGIKRDLRLSGIVFSVGLQFSLGTN